MVAGPVSKLTADRRLGRLLALIPWVAAHNGPRIQDVCSRFGCTEAELVADLETLFVCGLYPYTPDMLVDVDFAEGRVWIRMADFFSRPLRLTSTEAWVLVAAGQALLTLPGAEPDGPLGRALAKLANALGVDPTNALEITMGGASEQVMTAVRDARGRSQRLEIEYYTFGRDSWTTRVVDPYDVFSTGGQWYLMAYCHNAEDERVFRLDRMRQATVLVSTFLAPEDSNERRDDRAVYRPGPGDPRVILDLEPGGRWVAEHYPVEQSEDLGHGRVRVTLSVSRQSWLERLLLRLGPNATVVEGDAAVRNVAAQRLMRRYHGVPVASPSNE